ncbi:hypothetical protein GCM10027610_024630 [Dactylosporangium cerinum]
MSALEALIEPQEIGDPVSPLRWTTASLRDLARELTAAGHPVSAPAVGRLLRSMGFSLQGMAKIRAGSQVPGRDEQFRHINTMVEGFLARQLPVVSVDAKKKEPIGDFARAGRSYRPTRTPITAPDHDFVAPDTPIAIPYGVYDLGRDTGWVNVGTNRNTTAFAVESIRRWWNQQGRQDHHGAAQLLITADAGGANAADSYLFKSALPGPGTGHAGCRGSTSKEDQGDGSRCPRPDRRFDAGGQPHRSGRQPEQGVDQEEEPDPATERRRQREAYPIGQAGHSFPFPCRHRRLPASAFRYLLPSLAVAGGFGGNFPGCERAARLGRPAKILSAVK